MRDERAPSIPWDKPCALGKVELRMYKRMRDFQSGGSARLRGGGGGGGVGIFWQRTQTGRSRPALPLRWMKTCYFTPRDLFPPFQKKEGQRAELEIQRP